MQETDPEAPVTLDHKGAEKTINIFVGLVYALIFLGALNSFVDIWTEYNRRQSRDDISELLTIIQDQTSPERQEQSQRAVAQILVSMDCNNRKALEEAIAQLGNGMSIDITPEESCGPGTGTG